MNRSVIVNAAKLAQWRAEGADFLSIKEARKAKRAEYIMPLIRKYVSPDDFSKIRKRGCLHSVDFPEKRDRSLRRNRRNFAQS